MSDGSLGLQFFQMFFLLQPFVEILFVFRAFLLFFFVFLLPVLPAPRFAFRFHPAPLQQLFRRQPVLRSQPVVARQPRPLGISSFGPLIAVRSVCRADFSGRRRRRRRFLFDYQFGPFPAALVRLKFQKQIRVRGLAAVPRDRFAPAAAVIFRRFQIYTEKFVVGRIRCGGCPAVVSVQWFQFALGVQLKVICRPRAGFAVIAVYRLARFSRRRRRFLHRYLIKFHFLRVIIIPLRRSAEITIIIIIIGVFRRRSVHRRRLLSVVRPVFTLLLLRLFTIPNLPQFVPQLVRVQLFGHVYIHAVDTIRTAAIIFAGGGGFTRILVHFVLRVSEQFREVRHLFVDRRALLARPVVPVHYRFELVAGFDYVYEQRAATAAAVRRIRRETPAERRGTGARGIRSVVRDRAAVVRAVVARRRPVRRTHHVVLVVLVVSRQIYSGHDVVSAFVPPEIGAAVKCFRTDRNRTCNGNTIV